MLADSVGRGGIGEEGVMERFSLGLGRPQRQTCARLWPYFADVELLEVLERLAARVVQLKEHRAVDIPRLRDGVGAGGAGVAQPPAACAAANERVAPARG